MVPDNKVTVPDLEQLINTLTNFKKSVANIPQDDEPVILPVKP